MPVACDLIFEEENSKGNKNNSGGVFFEQSGSNLFSYSISMNEKMQKDMQMDDIARAQQKRIEDFKVLEPVIERSMKNIRNGFEARINLCMNYNTISSFDYCISPLFNIHNHLKREFALGTAFILRQYNMCLDNQFSSEYCSHNAESRFKEMTSDFYNRMNISHTQVQNMNTTQDSFRTQAHIGVNGVNLNIEIDVGALD